MIDSDKQSSSTDTGADLFEGFLRAAVSAQRQPIARREKGEPAPLTSTQQGFWFQALLNPGETPHNVTKALLIRGGVDAALLEESINRIVQRHAIWRTRFVSQEGWPVQEIVPELHIPLHVYHFRAPSEGTAVLDYEPVRELIHSDNTTPFDLSTGPLLRMTLVNIGRSKYILLFTVHHIGIDGWSIPLFINELCAIYEGLIKGNPPVVPVLPIQFADYAVWQQQWSRGEEAMRQTKFWKQRLDGCPALSTLPPDVERPAILADHTNHVYRIISPDLVSQIGQFAREENVTVFMLFLAALFVLLYRRSGQDDLLIGAPVAGRNHGQTRNLIGCFLNTVVLRVDMSRTRTYRDLLRQIRRDVLDAHANQDLSFPDLVKAIGPARSRSHAPLFQVMLNHKDFSKVTWTSDDLAMEELNVKGDGTTLDLVFETAYYGSDLWCSVSYNSLLYNETTVRALQKDFIAQIKTIIRYPRRGSKQFP